MACVPDPSTCGYPRGLDLSADHLRSGSGDVAIIYIYYLCVCVCRVPIKGRGGSVNAVVPGPGHK